MFQNFNVLQKLQIEEKESYLVTKQSGLTEQKRLQNKIELYFCLV